MQSKTSNNKVQVKQPPFNIPPYASILSPHCRLTGECKLPRAGGEPAQAAPQQLLAASQHLRRYSSCWKPAWGHRCPPTSWGKLNILHTRVLRPYEGLPEGLNPRAAQLASRAHRNATTQQLTTCWPVGHIPNSSYSGHDPLLTSKGPRPLCTQ